MAVRTMYVTDTFQNEPTAYMPRAFAPSDATTAASIVHKAHRSPRRTAKCTKAKDAMPMPTRPPPRVCSKWRINDVVAAGTSAVPRKRLCTSNSARIVKSPTPPSAIAVATTYRMSKPDAASGQGPAVPTQAEAAHPATTASNPPLQQPNAAPVRACVHAATLKAVEPKALRPSSRMLPWGVRRRFTTAC